MSSVGGSVPPPLSSLTPQGKSSSISPLAGLYLISLELIRMPNKNTHPSLPLYTFLEFWRSLLPRWRTITVTPTHDTARFLTIRPHSFLSIFHQASTTPILWLVTFVSIVSFPEFVCTSLSHTYALFLLPTSHPPLGVRLFGQQPANVVGFWDSLPFVSLRVLFFLLRQPSAALFVRVDLVCVSLILQAGEHRS